MKFPTAVARTLVACMLVSLVGVAVAQQAYPSKPIRLISPNPPGGGTSSLGRLVGLKLTEHWGQQVILDNRPGGNGFIGGEALAKSPPDGHTLMVMTSTHIITPSLFPAPYDPINDFAPVATLAVTEELLVLHPSVPANNLKEFIAYAKSKPGELNYGSSGAGAVTRLAGALFDIMTGTKMQNIAYKGTGQALTDLLGGQVQLTFTNTISVTPHIKSGKLKAIAITGERRSSVLPQVPTFTEAGLTGFDPKAWYGILAPARTPKGIVDKLSTEIARILAMPDIADRLSGEGADPFISTPEQFAALMRTDMAKFAQIIKTANIKPDQ